MTGRPKQDLLPHAGAATRRLANAVDRKRLEQAIEEQLRFERLVTDISARFASLSMEDIDTEITRALQQITKFLGVDQTACLKFSGEQGTLVSTHFYNAPGVTAPPPPLVLHLQYPWYTSKVRQGETIRLESLPDDLPPEAVNEREFVVAKGMRAHLAIPIKVTGSVTFVLAALSFRSPALARCGGQRLQLLGKSSPAPHAQAPLDALQESEAKFRLLAETATCGIAIYQDGRFQYVSPRATEVTGYSVDEMLSLSVEQLVHPDSRALVLDRTQRRLRGEPVPPRYEIKILTKQGEERWVDFTAAVTQYRGKPHYWNGLRRNPAETRSGGPAGAGRPAHPRAGR
jgi:PAS domain S-box-containing protein